MTRQRRLECRRRWDSSGRPVGRTRVRLAELLTEQMREQFGLTSEVHAEQIRKTDGWDGERWVAFIWREMPWGGYLATIYGDPTMGDCVKHGLSIIEDPSHSPTSYRAVLGAAA